MHNDADILREKAENSLMLCIEIFNRPTDRGRSDTVLILLDHSFEMLLKSSILHRKGTIQKKGLNQTIGFQDCLNVCFNDKNVKFLTKEQLILLQTINNLRDASQHFYHSINEQYLYLFTQAGFTLFRTIYKNIFGIDISTKLPSRVLPISTVPPLDIHTLFENDVKELYKLLSISQDIDTQGAIRTLLLIDNAIQGKDLQPTEEKIREVTDDIMKGKSYSEIFQGVASIKISDDKSGLPFNLILSKNASGQGAPVVLVPEGTPGAMVVAVQKLKETSYFNMTNTMLSEKLNISLYEMYAVMDYLKLRDDSDCCLKIRHGQGIIYHYSPEAIVKINKVVESKNPPLSKIRDLYRSKRSNAREKSSINASEN